MFVPDDIDCRKKMLKRKNEGKKSFLEFSIKTKKVIKDVLHSTIKMEENFEVNRNIALDHGNYQITKRVFDLLDRNKDGLIDFEEFATSFVDPKFEVRTSKLTLNTMFEQFDKDKDGYINFHEFYAGLGDKKK
jgi:Ca2+-binding EF-hand superfamily protein